MPACDEPVVVKRIPMAAFGKARPRVTRNGTYMPDEYTDNKEALRLAFGPVPAGMVHLSVTAVRRMPVSWSKKKRAAMDGCYTQAGPDNDNILGAVMDALFHQDNRVVTTFCEKLWGYEHELVIEVAVAGRRPA